MRSTNSTSRVTMDTSVMKMPVLIANLCWNSKQTDSDIEGAIIHEIFISESLSHISNVPIAFGDTRLPTYDISLVTEFIDGQNLATSLIDDTIMNLTFKERSDIELGSCKG
ncbi:unnamed protein product, partial [Rotaria sp. Silwood2]